MPQRNDPYSRPIHATRPDAKLVGEFYGRPATDKARNHAAGPRQAAGVRALPSVVPVDMDARRLRDAEPPIKLEKKEPKQRKPAAEEPTPSPSLNSDATSPSDDTTEPPITEEDLFG